MLASLLNEGFELVAPALWAYETTSTLCKAIYFEQLTSDEGQRALSQIIELDVRLISPDDWQNRQAFDWTLRLRRAAAYDSYYLALAEGMMGFTVTNARPAIAPTFGSEPMLGTNPIAFAAPSDMPYPFCFDGATSITQRGKIEADHSPRQPLLKADHSPRQL